MIGQVIKAWRERHRISLRDFGKVIGISAATVSRIECGKPCDQWTMLRLIWWLFKNDSKGSLPKTAPNMQSTPVLCPKCQRDRVIPNNDGSMWLCVDCAHGWQS